LVLAGRAAAVAAALGSAAAARADAYVIDPGAEDGDAPYVPELREPVRFAIGFDVGLGSLDGVGGGYAAKGGIAVDAWSGALVTRRLAVLGELFAVLHLLPADTAEDRGLLWHGFLTAAARTWLTPQLWLQAGAGLGILRAEVRGPDDAAYAPGVTFAIGGEVDHAPTRGIDLSVRAGAARYEDDDGSRVTFYDLAAVVGWHWL
jgi:hypothetical protein